MDDIQNDSVTGADVSAESGTSAPSEAAAAAPARKRRPRKPKAAEGETEATPKPRRTSRKKDAAEKAAAPEKPAPDAASSEGVSPEVAQARALAQISQASVVRRQRRAAERAAKIISSPDEPRSDAPRAEAPESAPAAQADRAPADAVSFIDPSLRPHRRGRKSKAYIEAEKRFEEARAAGLVPKDASFADAVAAASEMRDAPVKDAATPASDAEKPKRTEKSERAEKPSGRSRRKSSDAAKDAAASDAAADSAASAKTAPEQRSADAAPADAAKTPADGSEQEKAPRRTHQQRRERQQGGNGERNGNDRANDRGNGNDRNGNDRRNNRQQNRKNRNKDRYSAPAEPSLSRDDLAAMKVAELRDKARSLDIDFTGKKKAELIEEVYTAAARAEGFRDIEGILDITHEGFGYIRAHGYMPSRDDAFVPANLIRAARLRAGDLVAGTLRPSRANDKYPGLAKIASVNGVDPEEIRTRPKFSDLTPIYPNEPLKMEHGAESITGRAIDIVAPVGKGQRGLIVSPPKAGKTTILKKICQSIAANNPEVHLICLLVDERPEEVTDMQRSIKGDVVASTFDMPADNHTRVAELVIERAKRLVEMGGDVVVVLDSITRLARAYNLAAPASGRILSGGVDSAALYPPKRFLGAARNIENGGSLTILASALIETGSKMDEVIFEEFKGTGNMELKLDRDLADRRIFPAIDPVASGTRNEDLLIDPALQPFVWGIRRILAGMNNTERCAASFIKGLKATSSNQEFLIRSAKKAADHPDAL